jgi:signal transduction histidine kinase
LPLRDALQPRRHLLVISAAITLLLTGTLIWLSWQLVRQDEALFEQRIEERRESAADLATAALQKGLLQAEEALTSLSLTPAAETSVKAEDVATRWGAESVLAICRRDGVEAFPKGRLPFYPARPFPAPPARDVFARAESLEFLEEDTSKAAVALQGLVRSGDPAVRAGALARLARIHRKDGRLRDALAAYEDLAALGLVTVESLPADLVARHARLAVLEVLGERERAEREASALFRDVQAGRWRLLRAEYGFYTAEARRRLTAPPPGDERRAAIALAWAVDWMWETWRSAAQAKKAADGQRLLWCADTPVLLLWCATGEGMTGVAMGPGDVEARWLSTLAPVLEEQGLAIVLTDADGRAVSGRLAGDRRRQSVRLASATSLPWNLHLLTLDVGVRHAYFDARRRVLFGALLFIALLILAGSYFVWRALTREMAAARLQADFVSAVSHELRTPLTALQQFSELLVAGRVADESARLEYYEAMAHESRHLHRLVERLLDFGRIEANALRYRTEPVDPAALVRDLVAEFAGSGEARTHRIELSVNGSMRPVRADAEMLGCVIWNLLDNAVKYSPAGSTVWVELHQSAASAVVRVRDQGAGVRPEERDDIFRKFFRGTAARAGEVRGAGIGLAMARQIVAAHGGRLVVESTPGEGSVFIVELPFEG